MKGSGRGRVFGGNAGLWLFQKKFRRSDNDSNRKGQSTVASETIRDANNGSRSSHLRDSFDCSPVSTELSRSSRSSIGDCNENEKTDINSTNVATVSLSTKLGNTRNRRVFGVRKRHFETSSSDSESSVTPLSPAVQQDSNKRHCQIQALTDSSSVQSLMASQQHVPTSPSTNSSAFSIVSYSVDGLSASARNDAFQKVAVQNGIIDVATTGSTTLTQQSESSSVFDFDKDPIIQKLGYKTDLHVARQFFAQLDSDQTLLQIEDVRHGPEPPSTRKKCWIARTTRGRLPSNIAKSEYDKYCQACHSSKIKPFSKERFLQQRSEYFRVGDIYDGMFDE